MVNFKHDIWWCLCTCFLGNAFAFSQLAAEMRWFRFVCIDIHDLYVCSRIELVEFSCYLLEFDESDDRVSNFFLFWIT